MFGGDGHESLGLRVVGLSIWDNIMEDQSGKTSANTSRAKEAQFL